MYTYSKNHENVYGTDINENNMAIYDYGRNKAITIVTNFSKIVLRYAYRKAMIQQKWSKLYSVKSNKRLKVALGKFREKNVKIDIKLKLTKKITNIVRDRVIVLENLHKRFQDKVIERIEQLNGLNVHGLKQSSIRGIHKLIVKKLEEYSIPYALVNPRGTSPTCPIRSSKLTLMTGYAQRNGWKSRIMKCLKCGFVHDNNVIGAMNLAKKYLLDVGGCAVCLPKDAHGLYVEWLVTAMKRGVEAQPVLTRPTTT